MSQLTSSSFTLRSRFGALVISVGLARMVRRWIRDGIRLELQFAVDLQGTAWILRSWTLALRTGSDAHDFIETGPAVRQ